MPEIQKVSVAVAEEQVATQNSVMDPCEYVSIGQIVGEAIRDWQWKRGLRNKEIERLPKLSQRGVMALGFSTCLS